MSEEERSSPTQLDPIAAVNPLTDDAAQRLALGAAEDDLLARIVASGERPEPAPSRAARRSRGVLGPSPASPPPRCP